MYDTDIYILGVYNMYYMAASIRRASYLTQVMRYKVQQVRK